MRVIVVGAGVGGLAVARGLLEQGHEVEVYERGDALRTGGAGLGMYSNGVAVLEALGAGIGDLGRRIDVIDMCGTDGRTHMPIDFAWVSAVFGHECRTVPRRAVLERLAEGLPPEVVRFGARCTGVHRAPEGGAVAEFADGTTVGGDIVIGADGIGSPVRASLGHGAAKPWGWASWQALTPVPIDLAASTRTRCVQGKEGMCGIMPAGGGLVQWWFDTAWSPDDPAPASPVELLRSRFGHWTDPDVRAILAHAEDADLGLFPHQLHVVRETWGEGPVTLLGDAAHAFPPSTAQGANQALEDALALVRELGEGVEPGSAQDALRRYERKRYRPVALASRMSSRQLIMREQPPAFVGRMLSARVWGRMFRGYLRRVSTVLNEPPSVPMQRAARR